jgi:hypothetical protein
MPIKEFSARPMDERKAEQAYLRRRLGQVEKGFGKLAARLPAPSPLTPDQFAIARARELIGDLDREIRLRPLEHAIQNRLTWLERVEQRAKSDDGEPKPKYSGIPLDRAILGDLLKGWQATADGGR